MFFALLSLSAGLNAIAFSSEYYCAPKNFDGYNASYLYDAVSTVKSCDVWNSDFWKKNSPGEYGKCVQKYNENKARYSAGGCVPVAVKTYSFGTTKCTVKYLGSRNVGTYCEGPDSEKYLKQLQQ